MNFTPIDSRLRPPIGELVSYAHEERPNGGFAIGFSQLAHD